MVRNFGAARVACEWVAFVDDDDVLTPDYVGLALRSIRENPGMDILIFRMKNQDGVVLPPPGASVFEVNRVGISFCVRREVLLRFPFRPSPIEDFLFLDRCRSAGCGIVLSPHTTYLVRPK
jgi:glycosyltransferase involved in cell wall biosynthesis